MWENLRPIIGGIRADVTWIKVFVTLGVLDDGGMGQKGGQA